MNIGDIRNISIFVKVFLGAAVKEDEKCMFLVSQPLNQHTVVIIWSDCGECWVAVDWIG